MRIGVPAETMPAEDRVALTPAAVRQLAHHGHHVLVQTGAGLGAGISNEQYRANGAVIAGTAEQVWGESQLVVKVKDPQSEELRLILPGQAIFAFLHLAADPPLASGLQQADCIAIAYETVTDGFGRLPLLAPMSEVAGRMSIQAGATALERSHGGAGILLGGVPGTPPARVAVLGGGVVGSNAARMAAGMEADVTVLDTDLERLRALDRQFGRLINTVYANLDTVEQHVLDADLVIGAALQTGAAAPKLISREAVGGMRDGSVIVDVSIDQGGIAQTSHPTTHLDPTFVVDGVVHYCVSNMPGAVARTSTYALTNATFPFVLRLADLGVAEALRADPQLRAGLAVHRGRLTHPGLAPLGPISDPLDLLEG